MGNNEEWRVIPETNGDYEVSSLGNIRSTNRVITRCTGVKVRMRSINLKTSTNSRGYGSVTIHGKTKMVHRLVAESFIENDNKMRTCVNHINSNRLDNRVENLEWCTHKENSNHMIITGRRSMGERTHLTDLKDRDVFYILNFLLRSGLSQNRVGRLYNLSSTAIHRIASRKSWRHIEVLNTEPISRHKGNQ